MKGLTSRQGRSRAWVRRAAAAAALGVCAAPALGQFSTPASTAVRERISGSLLRGTDGPTPEAGDEVGAFFNNTICGRFVVGSGGLAADQFSIVIFGDVADTQAVEGPKTGDAVTFRFYDSSANTVLTNVRVENTSGEAFNYRYGGQQLPPIDLPGGIDLTPTRSLNLRIGAAASGGGGTPTPSTRGDVNGDGKINSEDAALILRAVVSGRADFSATSAPTNASGGTTTSGTNTTGTSTTGTSTTGTSTTGTGTTATAASRMDVNGDGLVTTDDAIAVLRL